MLFASAFGVFLTAACSACILSLLASIDERLQAAGHVRPAPTRSPPPIATDESPEAQKKYPSVLDEKVGPPGVKLAAGDEVDADLESKLNFQRARGGPD